MVTRALRELLPFFFVSLLSVVGGCSSLPDVQALIRDLQPIDDPRQTLRTAGALPSVADVVRQSMELETVGGTPVYHGNKVTLLNDGDETFAAMLRAMDNAREYIDLETYIIHDDDTGRRFVDLLLKKHAEGVSVNLIYDALGSRNTDRSFFERLANQGINVIEFNPLNFTRVWGANAFYRRTHRKMLVVDGEVAFTGGINIGSAYLKHPTADDGAAPPSLFWRDTHVMIEGPAVAAFEELFRRTWLDHRGVPSLIRPRVDPAERKGDQIVQIVGSMPGYNHRGSYVMYVSAVSWAQKSVHMVQSYFVPDSQMMQALIDAARRGVDVRIILPEHTDHAIVREATHSSYQSLLDAGVRLYERGNAVLHSKTAVIDGVWSTVGSTNLELWSFVTNDEANAVIIDRGFAEEMEASFQEDLAQSKEVLADEWRVRPLVERAKEFISNLFRYWM